MTTALSSLSERVSNPKLALPTGALALWFTYIVILVFYRLFLSPVARFPGPKLAGLTKWYEFHYEVIKKGQFTFHIQELHRIYGPIIRITPDELHIMDSDYFDELYVHTQRSDKYEWMAGRFGNSLSTFTTSDHDWHRVRRAPMNPMFSKRQIVALQPLISDKVSKLCEQLAELRKTGDVIDINKAFSAFSGDVITEYAFGICYNHLDIPLFRETFHEAYLAMSAFGHFALQFPSVGLILKALPESYVEKNNPPLSMLLKLQRDLRVKLKSIATDLNNPQQSDMQSHPTIFSELLQSNLPPQEKSFDRLGDEAQAVIGAGLVTTAWALTTASFHIISKPEIHQKLLAELREAMPDAKAALPDLARLEKLSYLRACIQEGIRMSYGVTARNPRLPHKDIMYKQWRIPARTPVSMTTVDVHDDETIFPDAKSFIPERWLGNPKAPNGSPLERYLVAFGKGSRQCLGINLAYAELFLALAAVFRRFRMELYETDNSDLELAHDFFLPSPRLDSKGVWVRIVGENA